MFHGKLEYYKGPRMTSRLNNEIEQLIQCLYTATVMPSVIPSVCPFTFHLFLLQLH